MSRLEVAGEVSDVQAHGGDVWIEEVEMVVITELDERLPVQYGFWSSEVLSCLLKLM